MLTEKEAEAQYLEKRQKVKCFAEKLKIEEELAKAKARIQIFYDYKTEGQEVTPVSDTAGIGKTNIF